MADITPEQIVQARLQARVYSVTRKTTIFLMIIPLSIYIIDWIFAWVSVFCGGGSTGSIQGVMIAFALCLTALLGVSVTSMLMNDVVRGRPLPPTPPTKTKIFNLISMPFSIAILVFAILGIFQSGGAPFPGLPITTSVIALAAAPVGFCLGCCTGIVLAFVLMRIVNSEQEQILQNERNAAGGGAAV